MKKPKTTEEAMQYLGEYFVVDKNSKRASPLPPGIRGQERSKPYLCIDVNGDSVRLLFPKGTASTVMDIRWWINWGFVELHTSKDFPDIEDLLDHWE